MSHIDDAKLFVCTSCLSGPGQECWPRNVETDANWVHTERLGVLQANNPMPPILVVR